MQAVKKSRVKSKQKTVETQDRVKNLKSSNKLLEAKIENHTKTLKFLKELFLAQAQAKPDKMSPEQWQELLKEDDEDDEDTADGVRAGASGSKSGASAASAPGGPSTSSSSGG